MKALGLTLLFIGVGLIAYAFNATDTVDSVVRSLLAQLETNLAANRTIWLLAGGSGAMVIGLTMIFKRPAGSKSTSTN